MFAILLSPNNWKVFRGPLSGVKNFLAVASSPPPSSLQELEVRPCRVADLVIAWR